MARAWLGLWAGAAAGAAGTTTLNVITYLDMVVRGRPASTTPSRTVEALAKFFHVTVPGTGEIQANRISGLGALTGYTAGVGIGVILGLACALGWRPGWLVAAAAATVGALAGTNGPMIALGVTDPRTWGALGWASDLIPHLGYGAITALVVHYLLYPPARSGPAP
jgi:hypothetical protein